MANRLTTDTDRFAGFASIVAPQAAPGNSSCLDPQGPIPVLFMGGTEDPIVPWNGGEASFYGLGSAGEVLSMDATLAHWRRRNGARGPARVEPLPDTDPDDGSVVVRRRWAGPEGADVVVYEVRGGGHTIPGGFRGAPEFLLGRTNRDFQALDEIWAFFENR